MDVHKNARLTVHCRALLVDRLLKGRALQQVAAEFGISVKTVHKWLQRYRSEGVRGCGFHACRPVIPADAGPSFHTMPGRV